MRFSTFSRCRGCVILLTVFGGVVDGEDEEKARRRTDKKNEVEILETSGGVRFGLWNRRPGSPAPTLFIFASTIDVTLGDPYYRQCGNALAQRGYLCVSMDLPCHGLEKRADEQEGLAGWRGRVDRGEAFMGDFRSKVGHVLSYLIAEKYTDPGRVAVCGTSRGGFVAVHYAAADARVKCIAAFAPVTDLGVLWEFRGLEKHPAIRSLALENCAEKLAGRAIWIAIGDQDHRVGTDQAIAFARSVSAASVRRNVASGVELHVLPEPGGHTTPDGVSEEAAAWIAKQLK